MRAHEPPKADLRYSALRKELLSLEAGFHPSLEETGDRTQAAVSLVLRGGNDPEILLIRRAEAEGDPWSGQMALPGGRRDSSDESLLHTAIRETSEETAVELGEEGIYLGRLEPTVPNTVRIPAITIFPFVFQVPPSVEARVSSREVDEVLWVPLSHLQAPEAASTVEIHYGDNSSRDFPCWRLGERVVWGLTYRILTGFLKFF